MAAADDFKILDEAVKDGKQSVTLPDGRTFTLEAARDERDRLGKEIAAAKAAKDREQSSAKLEIQNAETLVQKAANVVTANLRAFDKGNASAETVRRSQVKNYCDTRQEFLARLKSATVVTAPATVETAAATAPATAETVAGGVKVLGREQRGESVTPVPEEEDAPVVKPTKVVITKTQVDKKLVELNLADTPENRKVARQAIKDWHNCCAWCCRYFVGAVVQTELSAVQLDVHRLGSHQVCGCV
jgi:hypothetical protein